MDSLKPLLRLLLPALVAVSCVAELWAQGAGPDERVAGDTPVVKFATSTVKPWGMVLDGTETGLLIDVMQALQRETGIPIINEMLPYPRVIHSLYGGGVDFAVLFDSPSASKNAIRVGHLVDTRVLVIANAGEPAIDNIWALEGRLVGYIRGSRYGPEFDGARHFRKMPVNTMEQGLAMLVRNRLDAMAGTDQSFYWALKRMQLDSKRLAQLMVVRGATGSLYISKYSQHQDLIPVYQEALTRLHEDGTLGRIFSETHEWSAPEAWSGSKAP